MLGKTKEECVIKEGMRQPMRNLYQGNKGKEINLVFFLTAMLNSYKSPNCTTSSVTLKDSSPKANWFVQGHMWGKASLKLKSYWFFSTYKIVTGGPTVIPYYCSVAAFIMDNTESSRILPQRPGLRKSSNLHKTEARHLIACCWSGAEEDQYYKEG